MFSNLRLNYFALHDAGRADGAVVVIDVLRAFTTAAYAFHRGAYQILPVGSVEEAFTLKATLPKSLTMGEDQGYQPEGFDFGNSPSEIMDSDLSGRHLIQRTSAGTQGIIRAENAGTLVAASFVVAAATAEFLRKIKAERISFIITGQSHGRDGDEDRACAEYIAALLQGVRPDPGPYISRVLASSVGQAFSSGNLDYLSISVIRMSLEVNRFHFFMPATQVSGRWVINKVEG